jgi:diguanylate cyclase (GGDEF)-like protein/PAS domain S-box-containing protein
MTSFRKVARSHPARGRSQALLAELLEPFSGAGTRVSREMPRVLLRLELAGAAIIAAWLWFPGDRGLQKSWLALCLLLSVGLAVALSLVRRPLGATAYSLALGAVVALLGANIYFSTAQFSPLFVFYLWVVAFAGWYLPARHVWGQVSWIVISYGAAIVIHREPLEAHWWTVSNGAAGRWLLLSGTVIISAFLIQGFRRSFVDNEQQFFVAFERSATPMTVVGLDGLISYVNPAYCGLVGRSCDELIGMSVLQLTPPSERDVTAKSLASLTSGQPSTRREKRLLRGDGTEVWVDLAASLVTDRHGRPVRLFGQLLDITDRRAAEARAALRSGQQLAIAEIGRAALRGAGLEQLGGRIAAAAARLLGVEFAAVIRQANGSSPHVFAAAGAAAEGIGGHGVERWPLVTYTVARGEPVVVRDWLNERRFIPTELEQKLSLRSAVAVAVRGHQGAFGVLLAATEQQREFNEEDITFLCSLANVLAERAEQRHAEQQAQEALLRDRLTGLPNRVLFADLLRHSLSQPWHRRRSPALVFLDLDHFKIVNDSLGHDAGDQLLRELVGRLASVIRDSDVLARFGSDEFVVLYEDVSGSSGAVRVAERLLGALDRPFEIDGEELTLTATAGVVVAGEHDTAQSLLRDAEATMHRAKERSPGRYELFDPDTHARNLWRLRTENALRRAIGTDELSVAYQPIVRAGNGDTVGFEALLRWRHPDWGPVSPLEFIPIAEESGMIVPLGHQVLRESIRQLAAWRRQRSDIRLAVNVSARQLLDDALVDHVSRALAETGTPPSSLALELTETALVAESEAALEVLQALDQLGVYLALDDYGTGYASLSYLSRFPFKVVKLDRTLIAMLGRSNKDEIIIGSTTQMGHALGLTIVAEGVETEGQAAKLRAIGCDLIQGYLYGRPMPAAEIPSLKPSSGHPSRRRQTPTGTPPSEPSAFSAEIA